MRAPQHQDHQLTFGPIPSRRLGRSLGLNNIPAKVCSYACIYCQIGRTPKMQIERQAFTKPEHLVEQVRRRVDEVAAAGESIDYLSFVPDGEPTLDLNLGRHIELLRPLGLEIAVITNSSLLDRPEVRADLALADWVSLKVDSVHPEIWRRIDRPHGRLDLAAILDGALTFAETFNGRLVSETMLVEGLNHGERDLRNLASFLGRLQPHTAYLTIPTRPPAESGVKPPDEAAVTRAWHILSSTVERVECVTASEGDRFFGGDDVAAELLAITAVHPMRMQAVDRLLERAGRDRSVLRTLIDEARLVLVDYDGCTFVTNKLGRR